ncbi:MAG: DNA photolyase [Desulfobacteraceae bacterium]|jgi:spore photoproduct lyase
MPITHLYIDPQIAQLPVTLNFIKRSGLKPEILSDANVVFDKIKSASDPCKKAKQVLMLTRNKGSFLKQCPGTKAYTCCDYQILHIGSYCTMDCSYCILQSYFHPPVLQYFVNHDDLMGELEQQALDKPNIKRIGTGEFTDSLIWEKWSDLTPRLIEKFANQSSCVLELKTKTTAIDRLRAVGHNRKTIISWSLNTPRVIRSQERGTASLNARMAAAAQCQSWGYPLAFHFDPMVIYPGCEEEYRQVLELLFRSIRADSVVWISLGTFRFMPALKSVIEQRFPDSDIIYGEFIPGLDGKMRYFKPIRIRLYASMVRWIKDLAPDITTYLCMEDDQVWEKSYGFTPEAKGGLPAMLDRCAQYHCALSL